MTSNPLDDLRQINRQQREAQNPANDTALRDAVRTEVSAPALTALREQGRDDVSAEVQKPVRKQGRADTRKGGRTEAPKGGREEGRTAGRAEVTDFVDTERPQAPGPDLREKVRETVSEKRIYQGGVKATLDLAPELSTRFKRYSIDHHNVTLRQMMTELLTAYLSGEGY